MIHILAKLTKNEKNYFLLDSKREKIIGNNQLISDSLSAIIKKNKLTSYIAAAIITLICVVIFWTHILSFYDLSFSFRSLILSQAVVIIAGILVCKIINNRRYIYIEYDIDYDHKHYVNDWADALKPLFQCNKIWEIIGQSEIKNPKQEAGAGRSVDRENVGFAIVKQTKYIKVSDNYDIFQIVYKKTASYTALLFLPDYILKFEDKKIAIFSYEDLILSTTDVSFREYGRAPQDAVFSHYTWQYVNKNGSRDQRYKDNSRISVYTYTEIELKSGDVSLAHLMASDCNSANKFSDKANRLLGHQKNIYNNSETENEAGYTHKIISTNEIDFIDEIKRLNELLEVGKITQVEYESKKQQLLDKKKKELSEL